MKYLENIPEMWRKTSFNGFHSGYITTKIKKTDYGYKIYRFSNYVSLQYIRFEILKKGFAKATVKVHTNYRKPYQYTLYFDSDFIALRGNSTAQERKVWLKLQTK